MIAPTDITLDTRDAEEVVAELQRSNAPAIQLLQDFGIMKLDDILHVIATHIGAEVVSLKDREFPPLWSKDQHRRDALRLLEGDGPPFSIRGASQCPPDRILYPARARSIRRSFRHLTVNCGKRK